MIEPRRMKKKHVLIWHVMLLVRFAAINRLKKNDAHVSFTLQSAGSCQDPASVGSHNQSAWLKETRNVCMPCFH